MEEDHAHQLHSSLPVVSLHVEKLNLCHNLLNCEISFTSFSALKFLDLSWNRISVLKFSVFPQSLQRLDVSFNQIADIDTIGVLPNLTHLSINDNPVAKLPDSLTSSLPALKFINCQYCQLRSLPDDVLRIGRLVSSMEISERRPSAEHPLAVCCEEGNQFPSSAYLSQLRRTISNSAATRAATSPLRRPAISHPHQNSRPSSLIGNDSKVSEIRELVRATNLDFPELFNRRQLRATSSSASRAAIPQILPQISSSSFTVSRNEQVATEPPVQSRLSSHRAQLASLRTTTPPSTLTSIAAIDWQSVKSQLSPSPVPHFLDTLKATCASLQVSTDLDRWILGRLPAFAICPITLEVMESPVVLSDGHSYECDAIKAWLEKSSRSPLTNEELKNLVCLSCDSWSNVFCKQHPLANLTLRNAIVHSIEQLRLTVMSSADG